MGVGTTDGGLMAELLDAQALANALAGLPEWSGDSSAIHRTVTVDDGARDKLLEDLKVVAREMNHDPDLSFPDGGVTITMSTHSKGGVTDLDVRYAHRADELVARLV
jgi:4a-hydroxytetrahydrobiopterin dehydratase